MDYVTELAACIRSLEAEHGTMKADLDFVVVVDLIAQVQLALRHPGNTGPAAERAREMIEAIIDVMAESEPRIGPLLRMGFNPEHDVTR